MKRFLVILWLLIFCLSIQAGIVSYPDASLSNQGSGWGIVKFSFDVNDTNAADVNYVSLATNYAIYGKLDRITINSTGTEHCWGVRLKDDINVPLFTKTDCNSSLIPYGYAITQPDGSGSTCNYRDVAVFSPLTCYISDVNNTPEVQTISIAASGVTPDAGTYRISYGGQTTSAIAYGATTSAIDTALEALSTIGTGNIAAVAATALGYGNNIVITGTGDLAKKDLSAFTINTANLLDTGNNEQQTIARTCYRISSGHWHITYNTVKTGAIAYDGAKAAIDANLNAAYGAGKIVSTATDGINVNSVVLTFSGTGVAKTDVNAVTLDLTALLDANSAPATASVTESLKGKTDVIPTATVAETYKGGNNLNPIDVTVYFKGD